MNEFRVITFNNNSSLYKPATQNNKQPNSAFNKANIANSIGWSATGAIFGGLGLIAINEEINIKKISFKKLASIGAAFGSISAFYILYMKIKIILVCLPKI
ncbi:MAG: hypothetical protein MZV64_26360 [Ignavibacteriales bacterium]|nr:hypothetical protein [Ignavibacteriales bacterium]